MFITFITQNLLRQVIKKKHYIIVYAIFYLMTSDKSMFSFQIITPVFYVLKTNIMIIQY